MLRLAIAFLAIAFLPAFGQATGDLPEVRDDGFVVEKFAEGIPNSPTTMAFVGDDILVLQKTDG